jgi:Phage tail sheath protein FI
MADFHHGTRTTEITEGTRYLRTVNSGIIGLVATAQDADAEVFPLNKPVLITNIRNAIGKAGTDGTLAQTLQIIANQTSPLCVVVRVEAGTDEAETTSNVIGTITPENQYTGAQALLVAQSQLGVTPRILGAPGLDNQEVVNALISIAQKTRSFVYAHCEGETISDMLAYRDQFGQRELMLIAPDFLGWDTQTDATVTQPATAYALGLRSKIDNEQGWHVSISNEVLNGPTGISKNIGWALQSSDTDAGLLNSKEVTTLINYQGYRLWGNRTTSSEPLFAFETYVRTGQIIADTIAEGLFPFVDKPMTQNTIKDVIDTVNAKIRQWVTEGYLIGGKCWYDPEINTPETLKEGKLGITYDYTPVPPAEDIHGRQIITDVYWYDISIS